ncbi:MAG: Crp/Fnr family transcriptional regulator [Sulfurovum sp.]
MNFFHPQTIISDTEHMQKINYPATAICETDCKLLEIDYALFEKDFLRNPEISLKIIQSLSKKVKALQNVITTNLTMDTFSRICKFIYENENHINELSHRKIAAILNITPETLSRNLSTLKKDGIVAVNNRKIEILDKDRLFTVVDLNQ